MTTSLYYKIYQPKPGLGRSVSRPYCISAVLYACSNRSGSIHWSGIGTGTHILSLLTSRQCSLHSIELVDSINPPFVFAALIVFRSHIPVELAHTRHYHRRVSIFITRHAPGNYSIHRSLHSNELIDPINPPGIRYINSLSVTHSCRVIPYLSLSPTYVFLSS